MRKKNQYFSTECCHAEVRQTVMMSMQTVLASDTHFFFFARSKMASRTNIFFLVQNHAINSTSWLLRGETSETISPSKALARGHQSLRAEWADFDLRHFNLLSGKSVTAIQENEEIASEKKASTQKGRGLDMHTDLPVRTNRGRQVADKEVQKFTGEI